MNYMPYACKNPKCGARFLAEDLYGRMSEQKFRYCPKCEAAGFPVIREDVKNKNKTRPTSFKKKAERQKARGYGLFPLKGKEMVIAKS